MLRSAPETVASAPEYRALFDEGTRGAGRYRADARDRAFGLLPRLAPHGLLRRCHCPCCTSGRRASLPGGLGVLAASLCFAPLLLRLTRAGEAADTVRGVPSHGALAVRLVAVGPVAVAPDDVGLIWAGGAPVAALSIWRWPALVAASVGPDLARAAGIDPRRDDALLTLLPAPTVAPAFKVVGALLISALLILPSAAARIFARGPAVMALLAAALGAAAVLCGLALSPWLDTPAGPSIVVAAAAFYAAAR